MRVPDSGSWWRDQAACADPELLPLVDAACEKPAGPAGQELRRIACRHCPVRAQCLSEAMVNPEWGIWGGVTPNVRSRNGGPRRMQAADARQPVTV